jgi:uncharacterized membrane protein YdjX (TVP38/TMEM64 family)
MEPEGTPVTATDPPASFFVRAGRSITSLGMLGPWTAFTVLAPAAGAVVLATTTADWLPFLQQAGVPGLIGSTVLLAGLSLVPTHAASLVSGFLYGTSGGSLIALVAIALAAVLGYFLSLMLVGGRLQVAIAARPRAAAVHQALVHAGVLRTMTLIALVRLSPVMPFACTNLLLAASGVRFAPFMVGSVVGLFPRIAAVAVAGAALGELDLGAGSSGILLPVAGVVATVVALWGIGRLARAALQRLQVS